MKMDKRFSASRGLALRPQSGLCQWTPPGLLPRPPL